MAELSEVSEAASIAAARESESHEGQQQPLTPFRPFLRSLPSLQRADSWQPVSELAYALGWLLFGIILVAELLGTFVGVFGTLSRGPRISEASANSDRFRKQTASRPL